MPYYSQVVAMGNLCGDPETRFTNSGDQVTKFLMAINSHRDREKNDPVFIRVVTFAKPAEWAYDNLRKGDLTLVSGKLGMNSWENERGQRRTEVYIHANSVQGFPRVNGPHSGWEE